MPETADEASATRATYEPNGTSVSGVVMKWTADDQLKLCFKKGVAYYHKDATIVPGSISADGKTAKFTWEMPTEIGAGDTFDFYAVYQRPYMDETYGGVFEAGTANYKLVSQNYVNVTLNKERRDGDGIINPLHIYCQLRILSAKAHLLLYQPDKRSACLHSDESLLLRFT